MRILLIVIIGLMLSGCGIHERTTIRIKCTDNKVYLTVWQAIFVSQSEDIKFDSNLVLLNKEQISMRCETKGG